MISQNSLLRRLAMGALIFIGSMAGGRAADNVMLTGVPDYTWYAGCFGTASGNMMGYWDRHGFPSFYTGPTGGGVAPLNSVGANQGIQSLWASKAGVDGRPIDQPGHIDDYWVRYDDFGYSYESAAVDPYITAGRAEHSPDCTGDFIGASQNKWTNLNGECDGNIDAFSFTFWDGSGARRTNFVPKSASGEIIPDIPSGLRNWTKYKGTDAEVSSQLTDFNSAVTAGQGFSFADMKAEIDAGYPVMLFLQNFNEFTRSVPGMARANPEVHGMVAYGYYITDSGVPLVKYKTSWGSSGDVSQPTMSFWTADTWQAGLQLRGVIMYHPKPKITGISRVDPGQVHIQWDGPASERFDMVAAVKQQVHHYIVERSDSLEHPNFVAVSDELTDRQADVATATGNEFFRVRLVIAPPFVQP